VLVELFRYLLALVHHHHIAPALKNSIVLRWNPEISRIEYQSYMRSVWAFVDEQGAKDTHPL